MHIKNHILIDENVIDLLNNLSKAVNNLYGTVSIDGDNFGEPAINSGPCGPFANEFYKVWNAKFIEQVQICFLLRQDTDECYHIVNRLPDGNFFDGGVGYHKFELYHDKNLKILDMVNYDIDILDKYAHGLDRRYPKYCPEFDLNTVTMLLEEHISKIYDNFGIASI